MQVWSSMSISYCVALQYIHSALLLPCHKFLWCYFSKVKSLSRSPVFEKQDSGRRDSEDGNQIIWVALLVWALFMKHCLVNKLMFLYESMCTAFEASETHSKSTASGRLLWQMHLCIFQGRTIFLIPDWMPHKRLDLLHCHCISIE